MPDTEWLREYNEELAAENRHLRALLQASRYFVTDLALSRRIANQLDAADAAAVDGGGQRPKHD